MSCALRRHQGKRQERRCGAILLERHFKMTKGSRTTTTRTPMTATAAARIQSATAKANGGSVPKGSFAANAQSVAAKGSKQ